MKKIFQDKTKVEIEIFNASMWSRGERSVGSGSKKLSQISFRQIALASSQQVRITIFDVAGEPLKIIVLIK